MLIRQGSPRWPSDKESICQCRRWRFDPWVGNIPWRRKWLLTPVFLPGESHGQRSLVSYSPWGLKKSDMTELLSMHEVSRQSLGKKKQKEKSLVEQAASASPGGSLKIQILRAHLKPIKSETSGCHSACFFSFFNKLLFIYFGCAGSLLLCTSFL